MNYHRYTVVTHPTGCKIIEGDSCPVADYAALLTAWAKDSEPDDEVVCDGDLPQMLMNKSAVNVLAVVGRRSQLDALKAQSTNAGRSDALLEKRLSFIG